MSPGSPRSGRRPSARAPGRPGRSGDAERIGTVLDALSGRRPLAAGMSLGELGRRWEEVVGERLAKECSPATLEAGLLVVRAASAAWAAHVKFLAGQVRDRANQVLGFAAVRDVRVSVQEGSGTGSGAG